MPLTPEDVIRKNFPTTRFRGGYVATEVDSFLEEIIAEFRRLRSTADEQQAELNSLRTRANTGPHDVELEKAQLDQVRRERDAVVAELGAAERKLDDARDAAESAELAKQQSLEEIRSRFDDQLLELERRVAAAQDETEAAEEDSRQRIRASEDLARDAEARTVLLRQRLGTFSAEVREAAAAHLGQETVADLIPFAEDLGDDPVAQAGAAAALAERIRRDHLSAGQREAERLISEATQERESLLAAARQECEELLSLARTERDVALVDAKEQLESAELRARDLVVSAESDAAQLIEEGSAQKLSILAEAQAQHDDLLERGRQEHDALVERASREMQEEQRKVSAESARILEEAQIERDAVLADLGSRRHALEIRLAELDDSQREFRGRVRELLNAQLTSLDSVDWER